MGYEGQSLTSLFDAEPQAAVRVAGRRMAGRAAELWQEVTTQNTPIGGRAREGEGGGNLRSSWYQLPVQRVAHLGGWAYESGIASDVEYAPHVEYGTGLWGPSGSKYPIRSKTPGGVLRWRGAGGYVYAREVMHPGSPGQHMVAIGGAAVEAEDEGLFADIWAEFVRTVEANVS